MSVFCLCMDCSRLNHPSKSKCLSVQTHNIPDLSPMLVTLVTFIYRFVCRDMPTLLDHMFQCQWDEVSEIRWWLCCFFFLLRFVAHGTVGTDTEIQRASRKHRNVFDQSRSCLLRFRDLMCNHQEHDERNSFFRGEARSTLTKNTGTQDVLVQRCSCLPQHLSKNKDEIKLHS